MAGDVEKGQAEAERPAGEKAEQGLLAQELAGRMAIAPMGLPRIKAATSGRRLWLVIAAILLALCVCVPLCVALFSSTPN